MWAKKKSSLDIVDERTFNHGVCWGVCCCCWRWCMSLFDGMREFRVLSFIAVVFDSFFLFLYLVLFGVLLSNNSENVYFCCCHHTEITMGIYGMLSCLVNTHIKTDKLLLNNNNWRKTEDTINRYVHIVCINKHTYVMWLVINFNQPSGSGKHFSWLYLTFLVMVVHFFVLVEKLCFFVC